MRLISQWMRWGSFHSGWDEAHLTVDEMRLISQWMRWGSFHSWWDEAHFTVDEMRLISQWMRWGSFHSGWDEAHITVDEMRLISQWMRWGSFHSGWDEAHFTVDEMRFISQWVRWGSFHSGWDEAHFTVDEMRLISQWMKWGSFYSFLKVYLAIWPKHRIRHSADTKRSPNVGLMLAERRRASQSVALKQHRINVSYLLGCQFRGQFTQFYIHLPFHEKRSARRFHRSFFQILEHKQHHVQKKKPSAKRRSNAGAAFSQLWSSLSCYTGN